MKTIPLSRGKETTVDDEVYDALMQHGWKWSCSSKGYAVTNIYYRDSKGKQSTTIRLHRWVLDSFYNVRLGGLLVDHINGNKLDNRRENLRAATRSQNGCNRSKTRNNKTGYKGVHCNERGVFVASLKIKNKGKSPRSF